MIVRFHNWDCEVVFDMYSYNGNNGIRLNDIRDGGLVTVATMNVQEELAHNEVAINDFEENRGVLDILISAGVLMPPKRFIHTGWLNIPICEIMCAR